MENKMTPTTNSNNEPPEEIMNWIQDRIENAEKENGAFEGSTCFWITDTAVAMYNKLMHDHSIVSAVNNTYGKGIDPSSVPDLLNALQNILLDAEPLKGDEQVAIPKISIKLIKAAIAKSIIKQ
jgi:hypothetical protein